MEDNLSPSSVRFPEFLKDNSKQMFMYHSEFTFLHCTGATIARCLVFLKKPIQSTAIYFPFHMLKSTSTKRRYNIYFLTLLQTNLYVTSLNGLQFLWFQPKHSFYSQYRMYAGSSNAYRVLISRSHDHLAISICSQY